MGVTLFDELVVWQFDVIRGIAIGADPDSEAMADDA